MGNKKLINLLAFISLACLLVMTGRWEITRFSILGMSAGIISIFVFIFFYGIIEKIPSFKMEKEKYMTWIFSMASTIVFGYQFNGKYTKLLQYFLKNPKLSSMNEFVSILEKYTLHTTLLVALISFFGVFILWKFVMVFLLDKILEFFKNLNGEEKKYLKISVTLFSVGVVYAFSKTNIWYAPNDGGNLRVIDVLFTADSGHIYLTDIYMTIAGGANDIRQPLFGILSVPLATLAHILGWIFFFIKDSYALFLMLIQSGLLPISVVLLGRMIEIDDRNSKYLFYCLMSVSYSFLLWALPVEQYIISYFYLILCIYCSLNSKNKKITEYLYIAATGTMLTSGAIFPVLFKEFQIKEIMIKMIKLVMGFIISVITIGQLVVFIRVQSLFNLLNDYGGKTIGIEEKFYQFLNFVSLCFIAPKTYIGDYWEGGFMSFHMNPELSFNFLGIIILFFSIFGAYLNREDRFMRFCSSWIIFSFLILFVVGWGTPENGLVLYGLYFSWAYVCLCYKTLEKIFKGNRHFHKIMIGMILVMIFLNLRGIQDIIDFGSLYYPK